MRGRSPLLAGLLAGGLGAVLYLAACARPAPLHQPVAFNHRVHVQAGVQCVGCHESAETGLRAGLPGPPVCGICHTSQLGKSAEEAKLRKILAAGKPLEWSPALRLPSHVYFSHRRHVKIGGLACKTCHAGIATSTAPPTSFPPVGTMDNCLACHQKRQASIDCIRCHE